MPTLQPPHLVSLTADHIHTLHDNIMLAKTGITKAAYLLKRQGQSPKNHWSSCFVVLNDHCLSYCSERHNFERPDGNLLLSIGTRVCQQDGEETVIRIETALDVIYLKGKDENEASEWKRSICSNVERLAELARGQFRVKSKGRVKEYFLLLHRECITIHPSLSETNKILNIFQLTESSSFKVKGDSIEFKSGNGETLSIAAKNDIEHRQWCFALEMAITRLQKGASKVVHPPTLPIHGGTLLCLDTASNKWKRKYVVLTENSIYMHGHRRFGFDSPQNYKLTPNAMVFLTNLKEHSFEVS